MRKSRYLHRFFLSSARALTLACAGGLSACGGGGGSSVVATQFPLQLAMSRFYLAGSEQSTAISGTANLSGTQYPVTGTATVVRSPAKLTVYGGKAAYVVTTTTTGRALVNGQSLPIATSTQDYFSLTFAPLGSTSSGANCVAQSAGAYPVTVTVGQAGTVASYTCTSGASDPGGAASISFSTTPGASAATALFTVTENLVDPLGVPIGSLQVQYAMDTAGNMSMVYQLQLLILGGIPMTLTFAAQSA